MHIPKMLTQLKKQLAEEQKLEHIGRSSGLDDQHSQIYASVAIHEPYSKLPGPISYCL